MLCVTIEQYHELYRQYMGLWPGRDESWIDGDITDLSRILDLV